MHLARQHNLRQLEACSARLKPQHNPLNLLSVVVLALLDPLVLPLEQGLVHLASSSSSNHSNHNNHSSHSNSSSSRPGPGLVRLAKLSHSNRPALELVDSVPHSRRSSKPVVSSAQGIPPSVKSPPPVDSVRASRFSLAHATDVSQAPRPQVPGFLVLVPGALARHSPRTPLPLAPLPNSPRPVRLAPGDLVPVSSKTRYLFLNLMLVFS